MKPPITKLQLEAVLETLFDQKPTDPSLRYNCYATSRALQDYSEQIQEAASTPTRMETERGFTIYQWLDRYGVPCSLQKSSLAFEECVWLGAGHERMHLTQAQVKALLPLLENFVKTGELP